MADQEQAAGSEAWVPRQVKIRPAKRTTATTRATGKRPGRSRPAWDVVWTFDGQRFFRRFDRSAEAEDFVVALQRGVANQLLFDPVGRRFIGPDAASQASVGEQERPADRDVAPEGPTVAAWTQRYWDWKWPTLEPKGRSELSRYLNRVRGHFVTVPEGSDEAMAIGAYLRRCSLAVKPVEPSAEDRVGADLLRRHSMPLSPIGRSELEEFVARFSVNQRYPDRKVSPTTVRRMVADLQQCWARAVVEEVLDVNPWDRVVLSSRARGTRSAKPGVVPADAELVLSPEQIIELAEACTRLGSWGEVVRAFVLVMGFCGLRPSEATGLVVDDLEFDDDGGWLTVRRSRRNIPARYLDLEEDPEWGPLKGRLLADSRRVPIPASIAHVLRDHVDRFCTSGSPSELVFQRNSKPFDLSVFGRQVWEPARRSLFPPRPDLEPDSPLQPRLTRLRRHDLRHSACSMWLRARVDVSVCQRWSGHKRLSVFLDVYQGLIPGREEEGVRLVNGMLGRGGNGKDPPVAVPMH